MGSATNLFFKEWFETAFSTAPRLDPLKWMFYSVPGMFLATLLTWIYLQWLYMGMFRPNSPEAEAIRTDKAAELETRKAIESRYKELGPMSAHEKSVAIVFLLSVQTYPWMGRLTRKHVIIRMPFTIR